MNTNEKLYNEFKKMVKHSPYFCKNLPTANRNATCDICGNLYDYRYTPMVTDDTWRSFDNNAQFMCANCMERFNHGRLNINQLAPSLMSVNYLFCNDLEISNDEQTTSQLMKFCEFVNDRIQKYD